MIAGIMSDKERKVSGGRIERYLSKPIIKIDLEQILM
jgi:hypothetical protein